jgi:hypothetical protein
MTGRSGYNCGILVGFRRPLGVSAADPLALAFQLGKSEDFYVNGVWS